MRPQGHRFHGYIPPIKETSDEGIDNLRLAVLERACLDIKAGIVMELALPVHSLSLIDDAKTRTRLYELRQELIREKKRALEFMGTEWAKELGFNLDVDALRRETEITSVEIANILLRPYRLFTVKKKGLEPFLDTRQLVQICLTGMTRITPYGLLSHIFTDRRTGLHTVLFSVTLKGGPTVRYFGVELTEFGAPDFDPRPIYKRRLKMHSSTIKSIN